MLGGDEVGDVWLIVRERHRPHFRGVIPAVALLLDEHLAAVLEKHGAGLAVAGANLLAGAVLGVGGGGGHVPGI
jgi:hypothetical protein